MNIPLIARAFALFFLATATTLHAQVPQIINYQGRVAVGAVNFDGSGSFKFALVNGDGSVTYWRNSPDTTPADGVPDSAVALTVTKGLYSVLLGDTSLGASMTAIPATVFNNPDVRLRVWFDDGTINGSQLLTPDQRIAAVGYAMIASGVPDGAITSAKIAAGAVTNTQLAAGIDAAKITTGTFPPLSGANLTNLNGGSLTIGSVTLAALATGSVDSSKIADGTIVNADIAGAAAIADTKLATLSTVGKVANSATTATSANTASTIVLRDASGNFTAGTVSGIFSGNGAALTGLTAANLTGALPAINGVALTGLNASNITTGTFPPLSGANLTNLNAANLTIGTVPPAALATGSVDSSKIADGAILNADIAGAAAIVDTKLAAIVTAGKVANSATTATSANIASTIVLRDASGNFTAGTVSGIFSGNGAALTGLTAANLTGALPAINGVALTNLNGGSLIIGSVPMTALATGSVDSSKIADGAIVNADIAGAAAIAVSKISGLGSLATVTPAGTANGEKFLRGDNTWASPPHALAYDGLGNLLGTIVRWESNNVFYVANKNGYMFKLSTNGYFVADETVYWTGLNATGTPYVEDAGGNGVVEYRYVKALVHSPVGHKFYVSANIQPSGESASTLAVNTLSRESSSTGLIVNSNITVDSFQLSEVAGGAATIGLVTTGNPPKVATPITIK